MAACALAVVLPVVAVRVLLIAIADVRRGHYFVLRIAAWVAVAGHSLLRQGALVGGLYVARLVRLRGIPARARPF